MRRNAARLGTVGAAVGADNQGMLIQVWRNPPPRWQNAIAKDQGIGLFIHDNMVFLLLAKFYMPKQRIQTLLPASPLSSIRGYNSRFIPTKSERVAPGKYSLPSPPAV